MHQELMARILAWIVPMGVLTMLVGVSLSGGAYHIDYGKSENQADEWTTTPLASTGLLIIICETQGPNDKVNPNDENETAPGIGGLCYASSQDFAECDFLATNMTCMYNKTAEKEKKPHQNATHADWGLIQPKCTMQGGSPVPVCTPADVGPSGYFIRINSNTRSCDGTWGQTFAYKESIAYWGGSILNNETGASGHVTFFVNEPDAEGTYNRDKQINTMAPMADGETIDAAKTADNCTGNGASWGLIDKGIDKT